MKALDTRNLFGRRAWLLALVIIAASIALFLLVFGSLRPAPPKRVTLLTGSEGGAYRVFGDRYQRAFREQGIILELLETSGSVENLRRIKTDPAIDLALVQSGIANEPDSEDLVQLGSMFPEPLWIFHRDADATGRLDSLAGDRIAIGPPGSGTQLMALQMLAASGFDISSDALVAVGGLEAARQLRNGEVGAAFFVASNRAPAVRELLDASDTRLFDLELVDAYQARFRHLEVLRLPKGTLDLVALRPSRDIHLLGTSAMLVARADLHPAIISLMLQVAREVHGETDLFQKRGEFPAVRDDGLPLSPQAQRFYDSGPPFLQRYLPFWLAVVLDRLIVALLPALALLIPLMRIAPPLYAWRMRARIYRRYGELKFLEERFRSGADRDFDQLLARLDAIEEAANHGKVPLAFTNELYTLREHVLLVRQEVIRARRRTQGEPQQQDARA
ncbi:MAG: ABC transporter substrate-binding protein [Rhodocyclaceae bacterium]|nr:ABC transporter substrate-binding protein [Rhodocyclaceae bacterium]